jgi:hypothetical protein
MLFLDHADKGQDWKVPSQLATTFDLCEHWI